MVNEDDKKSGGVGLPEGTKIGKYVVREKLGLGGQAIVYKCHDPLLDRFVAVKQISTHLAADPRFLERFRKEAQILARLGSEQPAIVTIHELIENEQGLFIVMEYVSGRSLETILSETPGPIEPKAALQIIWRLAAALHAVHAAGIIHRDIKPSNIIVGEGLHVKITDFGVAASITGQTSMLLGTTKYMAPELFGGSAVDGRADMYSLGFIAYEILVGRAAFEDIFADVVRDRHSEALRWMKWHGNDQVSAPPLCEVNPAVPASLSDIVAKMMAKNPVERFESMEALGRAIKSSFSPRAKATAPRASQARRPEKVAVGVGELAEKGEMLPGDEGDELDLGPQAPPTAPIPKRSLSMRTRWILLGVVVTGMILVGVILLAKLSIEEKARQNSAAWLFNAAYGLYQKKGPYEDALKAYESQQYDKMLNAVKKQQADETLKEYSHGQYDAAMQAFEKERYDEALRAFEDAQYDTSLRVFEKLRKRFYGTPQSMKASVIMPLSEAYLAMGQKDWNTGYAKQDEAIKNRKEVMRIGGDPSKWAEQFSDDITSFSQTLINTHTFVITMQQARELVAQKKLDAALEKVDSELGKLASLGLLEKKELETFRTQVKRLDVSTRASDAIARGSALTEEKKFEDAEKALTEAQTILDSESVRVLPKADLDKLLEELKTAKARVKKEGAYAAAVLAIADARSKGDKQAELAALEQAIKINPDEKHKARIAELKVDLAYANILAMLDKPKPEEIEAAILALKDFLRQYPDHQKGQALLKGLQQDRERTLLVAKGDAHFEAREFEQALEQYKKAAALQMDPVLGEKIAKCQYQLEMAEGSRLRQGKQYEQARQKYGDIKQKYPAFAAEVDAILSDMDRQVQYEQSIKLAQDEIDNANYSKARATLDKIKPETRESRALKDKAIFLENMSLGKRAMDQEDWGAALGYFKIAKGKAAAEQEIKQVNELIAKVNELLGRREPIKPSP